MILSTFHFWTYQIAHIFILLLILLGSFAISIMFVTLVFYPLLYLSNLGPFLIDPVLNFLDHLQLYNCNDGYSECSSLSLFTMSAVVYALLITPFTYYFLSKLIIDRTRVHDSVNNESKKINWAIFAFLVFVPLIDVILFLLLANVLPDGDIFDYFLAKLIALIFFVFSVFAMGSIGMAALRAKKFTKDSYLKESI